MGTPVVIDTESTLNNACIISSTGESLNWPFRCLPVAVRFANVITTSSGRLSRMALNLRVVCVDMVRMERSVDTNMEEPGKAR